MGCLGGMNIAMMKKALKISGLMALVLMVFVAVTAFKSVDRVNGSSCTVTVKYSNGDPAKNVEVMPMNYGGIMGWTAADCGKFTTNSSGVVTIKWYGETIKGLYIKGNRYELTLEDGGSYTVTLKQKHEYD